MAQSFDRAIVQIDAVDYDIGGKRTRVDSKPVVLRSNFDLAGFQVFNRLIPASMPEFKLEGLAAERLTENLMSQANTEYRNASLD